MTVNCGVKTALIRLLGVNDMRLGDLDEALRMIKDSKTDNPFLRSITAPVWEMAHDCTISCVEAVPTIDAVPVVRCKDCKHYQTEDWDGDVLCGCTLHSAMLDITPDGFCSYGERKDGDS